MKTIKKNQISNKKIVRKTNVLKFVMLLMTITFLSCNDDNPITPEDTLSLTITVETAQDQIGDFAENEMVELNGKVWSIGGISNLNSGGLTETVWSSTNGKAWASVISEPIFNRKHHTLTAFDGALFLMGGVGESGSSLNDIWKSFDGINWTEITPEAPTLFSIGIEHRVVVFNNMLYYLNSSNQNGNDVVSVYSSPNGINWSTLTNDAFPYRENFEVVVFNNKLYAIGGRDGSNYYNTINESSDGINWVEVVPNSSIFSGRDLNTATVYNNKVWITGGQNATNIALAELWYSDDMVNWINYDGIEADSEGLHSHATLNFNDALWVFGGYSETFSGSGSTRLTGQIVSIKED